MLVNEPRKGRLRVVMRRAHEVCAWAFLTMVCGTSAGAVTSTAPVAQFSPADLQPCLVFDLKNVSQADPVLPGNPYFAISRANPGYADMLATVLTAAAGGQLLTVVTSGTITCGFADVSGIAILFR